MVSTIHNSISAGNTGSEFSIDGTTGEITLASALDHESTSSYTLTVQVSDGNGSTDTATVTVTVTDANDAPAFESSTYSLSVAEDAAIDHLVDTVMATDEDSDELTYYITAGDPNGRFSIEAKTGDSTMGEISVNGALDHETMSSYTLMVLVSDGNGRTDTATVTVTVTDANDAPAFESSTYSFSVAEDKAINHVVGTVMASDADSDELTYSISSGDPNGEFSIDAKVGDSTTGEITVAGTLDYESTPSYTLTVRASDGNGGTSTSTVTITVSDANDAPVFGSSTYTFSVAEEAASGASVGTVAATDDDSGDTLTYSITAGDPNGNFSIDSQAGDSTMGVITVAGTLDHETAPSYSLTVEVSDGNGGTDTATVTITVTEAVASPTMGITGLVTNMEEDESDSFSVVVSNLISSNSYTLRVTTNNSSTGFDSGCTDGHEDVSIPGGSTSHTESITLYGCRAPGSTVTATLLQGATPVATVTVDVTVTEAVNDPTVEITGLVTSMEEGESDSFSVVVSNLVSTNSYTLRVSTDNSNAGFDSGCTDQQEDITIPDGSTTHTGSLTLYGCTAPGGTVTVALLQGAAPVATVTADVTVEEEETTSNVTVTLSPRVVSYGTATDVTVEWTDPDNCNFLYHVGLYDSQGNLNRRFGDYPAPATTSLSVETSILWDTIPTTDLVARVSCEPLFEPELRLVGEASLQSGLPK